MDVNRATAMTVMTMKEAALVLMAGKKAAKRMGQDFEMDRMKMARLGFTPEMIQDIDDAVFRIEVFIEHELAKLQPR